MPQRILQTVTWPRLLALLFVSSQAVAGDILIDVEGRQGDAPVHLALVLADQPDWDTRVLHLIQGGEAELRLRDLPPGRYSVQLFQDLDGDGQLALSPRGVPRENGQPTPLRCLFEHGSGDTRITVKLRSKR